jgi:uncharacterized protein (DUF2062 family)
MSGSKVVARMVEFWKTNVLEPMLAFPGKEAPAEEVALCVVLGLVLGVCPVLGCPTIFCAMAALLLRLNLPAIQLVNFLAYPLQLTLLVPFIRLGGWLFRGGQGSAAVSRVFAWQAVYGVVTAGWHAAVAWFCVCAPAGFILYVCLVCVLRRCRTQLAPAC